MCYNNNNAGTLSPLRSATWTNISVLMVAHMDSSSQLMFNFLAPQFISLDLSYPSTHVSKSSSIFLVLFLSLLSFNFLLSNSLTRLCTCLKFQTTLNDSFHPFFNICNSQIIFFSSSRILSPKVCPFIDQKHLHSCYLSFYYDLF